MQGWERDQGRQGLRGDPGPDNIRMSVGGPRPQTLSAPLIFDTDKWYFPNLMKVLCGKAGFRCPSKKPEASKWTFQNQQARTKNEKS